MALDNKSVFNIKILILIVYKFSYNEFINDNIFLIQFCIKNLIKN